MHYCGICLRCKLISEGFFCHWPPGHVSEVYKRKSIEVIDDMEIVIKFGVFFLLWERQGGNLKENNKNLNAK